MVESPPLATSLTPLRRIFVVQSGLVVVATVLVLVARSLETPEGGGLGFFWFSFLAGCLGASVAFMRRLRTDANVAQEVSRSWISLLLPHLYGGLMAGFTYLLFLSGLLSGTGESGLLTSNLFPTFDKADTTAAPSMTTYLALRPATIADAGRLIVWCFVAGFSEGFVTGVLDLLDSRGGGGKGSNRG